VAALKNCFPTADTGHIEAARSAALPWDALHLVQDFDPEDLEALPDD
jgi:hypothetical protein